MNGNTSNRLLHGLAGGVLGALIVVFVSCAQGPDEAPVVVEAEPVEKEMTISFRDGEFGFNGQTIAFPAQMEALVGLLGPPSRRSDKANILHTWDELGIVAYEDADSMQVESFVVRFAEWKFDFGPKTQFQGSVALPGGTIRITSTPEDLRGLGFWDHKCPLEGSSFRTRLGDCVVDATIGDGVLGVYLGWIEYPRERSKPVPSADAPEPPLFEMTGKHRSGKRWFRELRRENRVSVATYGVDASGGAVGYGFFIMGALFEMCSQRAFPFFVVLSHGYVDDQIEMVVGYVDTDQPDIGTLFPTYFDDSRTYIALSTDPELGFVQLMDHPNALPVPEWPGGR